VRDAKVSGSAFVAVKGHVRLQIEAYAAVEQVPPVCQTEDEDFMKDGLRTKLSAMFELEVVRGYSARRASIGFMEAARHAGRKLARSEAMARSRPTAINVAASQD
jgi:hypothetical protein